ncbi:MAG: V-type ATP synthase subunit E family protein [Polyangiaceae bacterium]
MGIEELIARLERDADARVAAVETRAKSDVEAILTAADRTSSRTAEEALARRREERRARLSREIAGTRHRARGARLDAEHALLGRVLTRACALLDEMDLDPAYLSGLPERLEEALRFVQGHAARVRCRPLLAPAIRGALAGRSDVNVEEVPAMSAGFSVVSQDGSVEVDDTLPARLQRLRPRLLIELLPEVDS